MGNSQAYQGNEAFDLYTLCAYVEGTLPEDKRIVIDQELQNSEAFASKIEGIRYFFDGTKVDMDALQQFMNQTNKKQAAAISQYFIKKKSSKRIYRYVSMAAVVLVLFGVGISLLFVKPASQNTLLLAEQAISVPYEFPPSAVRGQSDSTLESENWMMNYKLQNYDAVISELRQREQLNEMQWFVLGLSFLYTQDYLKASTDFGQVIENHQLSSIYTDQARWFDAISLLKLEQIEAAKSTLEVIKKEGNKHYRYKEAMELLESIE